MIFTDIDLQTWPRAQMFYYFSKMAPTGYSLTVNLDVTKLRNTLKLKGLKFFPAYLWLVTKNLNRQQEFKIAEKDGVLGYYDTLTPFYASFHKDDCTFSLMWTEYIDTFHEFYQAYTVSCVPWIDFTHFAVHSFENKSYYFPSVEAGKFFEESGNVYMPLSITCHHATTDGYHVKCFLESLQKDIKDFKRYL